jgi:thymidylate synthase (FAD)
MVQLPILDHGYVKLVDHMGKDESIIEAARMSVDKGFISWEPYEDHPEGDMGLLRYLYKNKHHTPFEMCQLKIEVMAPIFVFREWHRHRTQSYNEMSARYIPMPDVHYVPSIERIMINAGAKNKQAGTVKDAEFPMTEERAALFRFELEEIYKRVEALYKFSLNMSVPKELARLPIPVARYSKMQVSANLRNWLAFLTLRMDPAAQWEIRQYANAVGTIIQELYPRTWELFVAGRTK